MKLGQQTLDLPGIDLKEGMYSWEDYNDYFYILNVFALKREHAIYEINQLLDTNNINKAIELIHAIKSTSGNLHLKQTYQTATILENHLRTPESDFKESMSQFSIALTEVLNSIQQLPKNQYVNNIKVAIDLKQLKNQFEELNYLFTLAIIDEDLLIKVKLIYEVLRPYYEDLAEQLKAQVNSYRFTEAKTTLAEIATQAGIKDFDIKPSGH